MANNGCQGLKLGERLTTDGLGNFGGWQNLFQVLIVMCGISVKTCRAIHLKEWSAGQSWRSRADSWPATVFGLVTLCPQPTDALSHSVRASPHLSPWHSVPSTGSPQHWMMMVAVSCSLSRFFSVPIVHLLFFLYGGAFIESFSFLGD